MPSRVPDRRRVSPFAVTLLVIALALVALGLFWFSDDHGKRAVLALVLAAVVAGGFGFAVYAAI